MYSFVQRSWVKARKTDDHAASAPTQPVFRIAPIHKRKKATARSVFIEDRKAQRSAAAKSEEGEEGEDGVEGVEEEGVENEENVAGEEGVQNEEGAKDDTVQTDAPTNLVKKVRASSFTSSIFSYTRTTPVASQPRRVAKEYDEGPPRASG